MQTLYTDKAQGRLGGMSPTIFFFFITIFLATSDPLLSHMNFKISFSFSTKKQSRDSDRNCIKPVDQFGECPLNIKSHGLLTDYVYGVI